MTASNFKELAEHIGHDIECVTYCGYNVSLECVDCNLVLLDFNNPAVLDESPVTKEAQ